MRVTVDTQHDSHEDIKKVIKMLQHLVGDSQEVFTNDPSAAESQISPIANIFGDASPSPQSTTTSEAAETQAQETAAETPAEASESTEDLFAELFSEEELKKMDTSKSKEEEEDEEEELKPARKKHDIEFY
ncbi:hypothetical protein J4480_03475 [Candidatus Woesearchaeota archaeon]|nr:hypothetical protein [Candidatus Woesearchaeota archaeon]